MDDKQLIATLGGATRLAELLGFDKKTGGAQRVHNWKKRGIPSFIKLQRPDLFATPKRATNSQVTRQDLRPDDWQDIWPELIDKEAA